MDNPQITHNTRLEGHGVQAYVETGRIKLDFNVGIEAGVRFLDLSTDEAERLIGILRAAVADKEA